MLERQQKQSGRAEPTLLRGWCPTWDRKQWLNKATLKVLSERGCDSTAQKPEVNGLTAHVTAFSILQYPSFCALCCTFSFVPISMGDANPADEDLKWQTDPGVFN